MVIVLGGTHHNTLSVIRSLGYKGVYPDLILCDPDGKHSYVSKSKYISRYHVARDCHEVLDVLINCYSIYKEKPILLICSDEIISLLDKQHDTLEQYFIYFNACDASRITHYMDKQVQVILAQNKGLKVPLSIVYDASVALPVFDEFPCIVKPLESINGGKRINICTDQETLNNVLSRFTDGETVLIQQYIKKDYEIVVDGLSLLNEIIIPGYIKKHRDSLGGTTYSTSYPISGLPSDILDAIKLMIREIQYIGLFGVEFIVRDGLYYFVEINLRNDATTYTISKSGINLPYIYVQAIKGLDYSDEVTNTFESVQSMVELRDFDNVLKGKVSYKRWFKERKGCKCLYYYDTTDIRPYRSAIYSYWIAKIHSIYHKVLSNRSINK